MLRIAWYFLSLVILKTITLEAWDVQHFFFVSSIVNDDITEFYAFLRKDPTRTKSTKSTRRQTSGFFFLDSFMRTKMLSFSFLFAYVRFVLFMPNKWVSSSYMFLCAFKNVFVFISLCAFCAFCACGIFS